MSKELKVISPSSCTGLLACPFCGREAISRVQGQFWIIGCPDAFRRMQRKRWDCPPHPFVLGDTQQEAERIWNTRKQANVELSDSRPKQPTT